MLGRKAQSRVCQLETSQGTVEDPEMICKTLSAHFSALSTGSGQVSDSTQNPWSLSSGICDTIFKFEPFEEEQVLGALRKLNIYKATGPDRISASLLKTLYTVISPSVTKLFNSFITSGQTPTEWKEANVIPIPKVTIAKLPSDYRPVSIIPVIAKVFESLVFGQFYNYLVTNSLLHPNQSGFRPSHCTQDILLKTIDDWRKALDKENVLELSL